MYCSAVVRFAFISLLRLITAMLMGLKEGQEKASKSIEGSAIYMEDTTVRRVSRVFILVMCTLVAFLHSFIRQRVLPAVVIPCTVHA